MCNRRPGRNLWARIALVGGIVIILALLLPGAFWWMVLAVVLIGVGLRFLCA